MRANKMGKTFKVFIFILLISILTGCEEKIIKSESDFEAIRAITLDENPSIFKSDIFDTLQDTLFYREITKRDFWISHPITEAPPESNYTHEVNVEIVDSIKGVFHHFLNGVEYVDSFEATSITKGYLVRWPEIPRHRGWILKKVSGNKIFTIPGASSFSSVIITSPAGKNTLLRSGITSLKSFKDILSFNSGDSITLELSPTKSTDYLYLHYDDGTNYIKRPFIKENGKFISGCKIDGKGYQHIFIDIIDKSSIDDSTASYKSNAWGILIQVE